MNTPSQQTKALLHPTAANNNSNNNNNNNKNNNNNNNIYIYISKLIASGKAVWHNTISKKSAYWFFIFCKPK